MVTRTEKVAYKRLFSMVATLVIIMIVFGIMALFFGNNALYVLVGMVIVLTTEEIMKWIFYEPLREYKKYSKGAKAEGRIGRYLKKELEKKLEEKFIVVNDIKLNENGGNIDHVVMGNNGIFLIETKSWKGKITYSGDDWTQKIKNYKNIVRSPSRQAKGLASDLKNFFNSEFPELHTGWINAIVLFEESEVERDKVSEKCKIFDKVEDLVKFIEGYKPESEIKISKQELLDLKESLEKFTGK